MDINLPESMEPAPRGVPIQPASVPDAEGLAVGEVASLVGVSVRTLHHWDSIELVRPKGRTPAGYRSYDAEDVARIHRVLVYQELGFSLAQIARLLDDPTADEAGQLRQQRELLDERIHRLQRMLGAVDRMLASRDAGISLTAQQQAQIFGSGWREDWAEDARERWGASEEWADFERRAAGLSDAERERLRLEGEALYEELATAKRSGVEPGSDDANRLAERHRAMIGEMFDCSHSKHVLMGRMFAEDDRFRDHFEALDSGFAEWLSEVIDANASGHDIEPEDAIWE